MGRDLRGRQVPAHHPTLQTDAEIIAASRDDPDAFGEIFDRYFQPVRAFVVSRVGPTDGPDLAAQVFASAFEGRHRFKSEYDSAKPWLYGIAANLVRRHFRKAKRGRTAFKRLAGRDQAELVSDPMPDVDAHLDAAERSARMRAALDQLRPQDRDIILLATWEGLSYAEIAESLGVPVGTVRSRLARSRERLRELVDASGQSGQTESTGS